MKDSTKIIAALLLLAALLGGGITCSVYHWRECRPFIRGGTARERADGE